MKLSQDQVRLYGELQKSQIASETYVFARKYGLSLSLAGIVISKFNGNVIKAVEFTEFYKDVLQGNFNDYLSVVENAAKNRFSFVPKEISLLEQEVMNKEGKFNLDLTRTYYRDVPGSSSHYEEHNATRALDR
mgnify:CR=1 FL=1